MNVASIAIIAIIVTLSMIAVKTSDEPLDELFRVDAAMNGFTLPPLATKTTSEPQGPRPIQASDCAEPAKGMLADGGAGRKANHLVPQSTTTF